MKTTSYAKEGTGPGYRHDFHAGNVGDVWKHTVLCELIWLLQRAVSRLRIYECHAGSGVYDLPGRGEWQEGIGRLLEHSNYPACLDRYMKGVKSCRAKFNKPLVYPGSPFLASEGMRERDQLTCYEIDPDVSQELRRHLGSDERVEIICGDGLKAMLEIDPASGEEVLIHIDPPWSAKQDWINIPKNLLEATKLLPQATFLLWYPIKSYTRVNAMHKLLHEGGLKYITTDLITTPLEHQRNRLNGSGVLLINPPADLLQVISSAGPWLGRVCSTFQQRWEFRMQEW